MSGVVDQGMRTRRDFIRSLFQAGVPAAMGIAASCAAPAEPTEVRVASVDRVGVGQAVPFRFGRARALLIHISHDRWAAVASDCTHGRCSVQYRADSAALLCPCHNGRFDLRGRVLGGPPTEPLERFAVELRGVDVWVTRET